MEAMAFQNLKSSCILKCILKQTGLFLFGCLALVVLASVYVLSAPVFLFRLLIIKIAKIVRPDLIRIVSPQGNLFSAELFSSKAPRCSLVVPIVLEGRFPESEFYRRFSIMVNTKDKDTGKEVYPEYKQYVEIFCGFAFWRNDPHFDIKNHVKFYNSGEHTDKENIANQELRDIVEMLLNKRFKPRKSPSELYVVNNYHNPKLSEAKEQTVMIMRLHHTLADGFSILYSLIQGLVQAPLSSRSLPVPTHVKRDKWNQLWFNVTFVFKLIHDIADYFVKGARKNPFNVPDHKKSWNQVYGNTEPYPVHKIKEIKDELGVTFTSVLLAAVAGSLSRITKAKVANKEEIGDRAAFFIPLPVPGGHRNAMINQVSGAQIDLPMENFSNPTLRVYDCNRQLEKQKSSTIPWLLYFLGNTLGLHVSSLCGQLTANRVNISGLTSFPIGSNDLYFDYGEFAGKVLSVELAAGALVGISGLAFMAISCGKFIHITVTAESSVLSRRDVDDVLYLLREEFDLLHEIVSQKSNE